MLELNMMTKKAVAAAATANNVMYSRNVPLRHRAYLHMYNTAYARRNVRQRAQLILQRVLCACFCFFFFFKRERERAAPWPPWVHPVAITLRLGYN